MLTERILIATDGTDTKMKELYNDRGQYLSTVTSRYIPVLHEDIENMAKESLKKMNIDFDLKTICPKRGRDCFLKFTLEGFDEKVKPQIILTNTYKSGKAMKLITGAFTMVCGNGAIIGTRFSEFTHRHFAELERSLFIDGIDKFIQSYPKHLEFLNVLEQKEANIEGLFLNWGESERDMDNIKSMFENRKSESTTSNRRGDSNRDLYETATEYYSHSKLNEGAKIRKLSYVSEKFNELVLA